MNELAVSRVLNVDHTPAVLTSAHRLAVNKNRALGANDREGNDVLRGVRRLDLHLGGMNAP